MNSLNVEKLMDHKIGLDPNYWRPIEHELLADYLKAAPVLTINDTESNVETLKEQQEALQKDKEEKDKRIEQLQKRIEAITASQDEMIKTVKDMKDMILQTTHKLRGEEKEKKEEETSN